MKHTSILQLTTSLLACALFGSTAFATGPTEDIKSGLAAITLDSSFVTGIGLGDTVLTKIAPAAYSPGKHILTVPITGGAFDLEVAETDIITGGGFKLTKGGLHISFSDIIVTLPDDPSQAEVSALVSYNGSYFGRVAICTFNSNVLNIPTPVSLPKNKIVLHDIPLKLSTNAATLLNNGLGVVNIYHAGDPVGLIEVSIKVAAKTF